MATFSIESGLQLFSRLNIRPIPEKLHSALFPEGLAPGALIEIGVSSDSDRTLLITDFIARCILPKKHNEFDLPGTNCGAILLNLDHRFNIMKLYGVLKYILKSSKVKIPNGEMEQIIQSSLKNLTLMNCYDHQQLEISLLNVDRLLQDNLNVGAVFVDSLGAQYWDYRQTAGITSLQWYHTKMLNTLQSNTKTYKIVVIFSINVDVQLVTDYKIVLNENKCSVIDCANNVQKVFRYSIGTTIKIKP